MEIKKESRSIYKEIGDRVNVPKTICSHLVGEKHSFLHRSSVGVILMIAGVFIASAPHDYHITHALAHYGFDVIGYSIHGIGLTPFIEGIIKSFAGD